MTTDTKTLTIELSEDGILQITLNRPEKLNALNHSVLTELNECFSEAKNNPKVKSLLITGEGKAFCAGADIRELADIETQRGVEFAGHGQDTFRLLETIGKPSIAAVNGFAFGGGCELAMAATIRIASQQAQFGQPEVKLGVIPGYGGTQRLSRLVGKGRAMDLCLTGRFIDAKTAYAWGLVTDVIAPEELIAHARTRLQEIMAMSPLAITAAMEVIDRGYDLPLDDALHLERMYFSYLSDTQDKKEGTQAFLEKRKAKFTGE